MPKFKRTTKKAVARTNKTYGIKPKKRVKSENQMSEIRAEGVRRECVKVGSMIRDSATGLEAMVVLMQVEADGTLFYNVQPRGLSPKDGGPVKSLWIVANRVQGGERIALPDLPINVLGTEVEDQASGFKGIAVSLALHITGCVHVSVQPQGKAEKTGGAFAPYSFDFRRLKGAAITPMTEVEREESQREKPSPGELATYQPAPLD